MNTLNTLLTPEHAINARQTLQLSQARVANDTGINRTYLSQFEQGKRLLDDKHMTALNDYFHGLGWEVTHAETELETPTQGEPRIIDGMLIAPAIAQDEAEALLNDYYQHAQRIKQFSQQDIKRNFLLGGVNEEATLALALPVLLLLNRQHQIKQALQGQLNMEDTELFNELSEVNTVQHYLDYLFHQYVTELTAE